MKKYLKRFKPKRFIDYFSYCFIMFTAIIFLMAFFDNGEKGEAYTGDFGSFSFDEGWTLELGGVTSEVTLPASTGAGDGDTVIIRNTLPDDLEGNNTILFRTRMEDLYIYIGGELRESYSSDGFENVSYHIPSAYVACELTPEDAGKEIEARFVVKNVGTIESIRIGSGNNVWFGVLKDNIILAVASLIILIVGIFVVVFYKFAAARFTIDRSFFYMGLFMCSLSMWMLSESRLRQLIFARPSLSNYFSYFAIEITGVFVCGYFDEIQRRVYHKLYVFISGLITAQIIVNLALNALGIADLFTTIFISHFWLAISIVLVNGTLIRDVVTGNFREYIASFVGTCIFLVFCMLEIVSFFFSDIWSFGVYICAGLMALLVATIIQTAFRTEKSSRAHEHEREESLLMTIEAITSAIDAKDEYTGGHSERVGEYACMIAREMAADYDFSEEDILRIRYIGFMHDIGKIGVADSVLNKTGRLTDEEFSLMKKHAEIGYDLLKSMGNSIEGLLEGIRHHHERFDGTGYPDGLEGTDIPLVARIICVADSYDAMTSNRVYRKRLTDEEVIAEIRKCSGKQFDPAIAEIFVHMLERGAMKAVTVDGMEVGLSGSVYRSSMLEKKLQSDIRADHDSVSNPSHVRMICYIMKLAEKNKRKFDIFFTGIEVPEEKRADADAVATARKAYSEHVMKYINKRDIYIEYGPSTGIVVLFDRDDEGMEKVRNMLLGYEGEGKAFISEL